MEKKPTEKHPKTLLLPPDPGHKPIKSDHRRPPPEPEDSPPRRREEHSSRAGHHRASERKRRSPRREDRPPRDRRTKRKTKHRAGKKHQRLHRLASNPWLTVHRKASGQVLELNSIRQDINPLDQPLLPDGGCGTGTRGFN